MSIYQSDPDSAPDEEYEPGRVDHMVTGNRARQLDWRRTPMTVVEVRPDVGFCTMRLDAFEDAGALWDIPFERIHHYQFESESATASTDDVALFHRAIERFDREFEIACDPTRTEENNRLLDREMHHADRWLGANSSFFDGGGDLPDPEHRVGAPQLFDDLDAYLRTRGVRDLESEFTRQFVSNPYAGEVVIGHRIVLAEMGLIPYAGPIVRDPLTFEGEWSRARRKRHLVVRLGFTRALFRRLGRSEITVYRGFTPHGSIETPRNHSFVSASFSRTVAQSHLHDPAGVLQEQRVPVARILMTYLETAAMNAMYEEAEAVLWFDPTNELF